MQEPVAGPLLPSKRVKMKVNLNKEDIVGDVDTEDGAVVCNEPYEFEKAMQTTQVAFKTPSPINTSGELS